MRFATRYLVRDADDDGDDDACASRARCIQRNQRNSVIGSSSTWATAIYSVATSSMEFTS